MSAIERWTDSESSVPPRRNAHIPEPPAPRRSETTGETGTSGVTEVTAVPDTTCVTTASGVTGEIPAETRAVVRQGRARSAHSPSETCPPRSGDVTRRLESVPETSCDVWDPYRGRPAATSGNTPRARSVPARRRRMATSRRERGVARRWAPRRGDEIPRLGHMMCRNKEVRECIRG